MAGSFLVKKGGGSTIKELIDSYKVKAGENISAGDFVDYVNSNELSKKNSVNYNTTYDNSNAIVKLDNNKVLVCYSTNNIGTTVRLISIDKKEITLGTAFVFTTLSTSGDINLFKLDNSRILVVLHAYYGDSSSIYSSILNIDNDVISAPNSPSVIDTTGFGNILSVAILGESKMLVTYNTYNDGVDLLVSRVLVISGTSVIFSDNTFTINNSQFGQISSINNSQVILLYTTTVSYYTSSVILNISNDNIISQENSPFIFFPNFASIVSTLTIDENRVIVAYSNSGESEAVILSINDGIISKPSSSFKIGELSMNGLAINRLSSNRLMLAFEFNINPNNSKISILSFEGTDIVSILDYFSSIDSGYVANIRIEVLNNSEVIIAYRNTIGYGVAAIFEFEKLLVPATEEILGIAKKKGTGGDIIEVFTDETAIPTKINGLIRSYKVAAGQNINVGSFVDYINGSDVTKRNSSELIFDSNQLVIDRLRATKLNNSKVLVVYSNSTYASSRIFNALVISINGTTITTGNFLPLNNEFYEIFDIVALDDSRAVVVYVSTNFDLRMNVLSINGMSITLNNHLVILSGDNIQFFAKITKLDNSRIMVLYQTNNFSVSDTYAIILVNVDQTSLNLLNDSLLTLTNERRNADLITLNSSKVLFNYVSFENPTYVGKSLIFSIDGNSITASTPITFNSTYTQLESSALLNDSKVLITYRRSGDNDYAGYARILSITNTNITVGDAFIYDANFAIYSSLSVLSSSKVVIVYRGWSAGYAKMLTIDGTTIFASEEIMFKNTFVTEISSLPLGNSKVITMYAGDFDRGSSIIIEQEKLITNTSSEKFSALSKTSGSSDDIIDIYMLP
jgi:hypothetical protein